MTAFLVLAGCGQAREKATSGQLPAYVALDPENLAYYAYI